LEDFGDVVVVRNFNLWLERSDEFLLRFVEMRVNEPEKLVVLSGVRASHIPLCVYMGGDIIIPAYTLILRSRGEVDTEAGPVPVRNWANGEMRWHNLLERAVGHLRAGTLREYVEGWPEITARRTVRFMDVRLYPLLEKVFPTERWGMRAPGTESLLRPEVRRYLDRLGTRYEHPNADALLLLPCSARKPYSLSRTHRKLSNALCLPARGVHEVVVTSPLGLVPRELESTFPARAYDIPVTGVWSADERERVCNTLRDFVKRGRYDALYAALPDDMRWMEQVLSDMGFSYVFYKDVRDLADTSVARAVRSRDRDSPVRRLQESMRAVMLYRFGLRVENLGVRRNRGWDLSVFSGDYEIMRYRYDTGATYMTRRGCELLLREGLYTVEIHDFPMRGDLFVGGIRDASPEIRPGDDVVLHSEGRLKGFGRSLLAGHEMVRLRRGMAVKVRKRF
jgi:archaeosine synthase